MGGAGWRLPQAKGTDSLRHVPGDLRGLGHPPCPAVIRQRQAHPADRDRLRVGSNPPQGWHLIGASQGVLPRSRRQVNKRVNGCPGRPGHYVETLSIHTTITPLFSNCLEKGVGQVGHDATDLTVAT